MDFPMQIFIREAFDLHKFKNEDQVFHEILLWRLLVELGRIHMCLHKNQWILVIFSVVVFWWKSFIQDKGINTKQKIMIIINQKITITEN